MFVRGPKSNPDYEKQKTHDRTEVPHIAEARWRQKLMEVSKEGYQRVAPEELEARLAQ